MKITIENPLPGQEEEIVIRAENLSPKILELLQLLKTDEEKLTGLLYRRKHGASGSGRCLLLRISGQQSLCLWRAKCR